MVQRAAADPVARLEHDDRAPGPDELAGRGQPGQPGAHDGDVGPADGAGGGLGGRRGRERERRAGGARGGAPEQAPPRDRPA
jgi:hypothetical protein